MNLWKRWQETEPFSSLPQSLFNALYFQYSLPHRAYHTPKRLEECFTDFDLIKDKLENPLAVETAIWFHDVVYNPPSTDNEERSVQFLEESPLTDFIDVKPSSKLILCSKQHKPYDNDSRYFVDIDRAILGKPWQRFKQYDKNIRKEYQMAPDFIYYPERQKILTTFLKQNPLFYTPEFRVKYEARAKQNLIRAIQKIQQRKL